MTAWSDARRRMDALVHRRREERELDEEMAFHLDMLTKRLEGEGVSPPEARRRALAAFGGLTPARENTREARGMMWFEDLTRDARFALRQLAAHPAFTLVVTITLALGIGATTTIFSAVDHVLLRPAPFDRPGELAVLWGTDRASSTTREPVSWPDITDFRTRARTVSGVAGFVATQVNLTATGAEPMRATAMATTGNYFSVLGVRALRGRTFTEADDQPGGPAIALVSEAAWHGRFNGDPAIIGQTIQVDEVATEIVGVLPHGADFGIDQVYDLAAYHPPYSPEGTIDIWVPARATAQQFPRQTHPFVAIGRLAPGASVAAAQQELEGIAADVERSFPENVGRSVHVEALDRVVFGESRPLLRVLLAAVVLLLVVAAVNVANLLLARGTSRVREVALRGALGASSSRLTRQFVAEGLVLMLLGTTAGVGLAIAAVRGLRAWGPADVPRLLETTLDARALAVALVVALAVGLVFGLVPVVTALRDDTMAVLKGEAGTMSMSRRGTRLRSGLVTAQVALCVSLAIGAGLVMRSFSAVLQVDPGFSSSGVMKAQYQLPGSRYPRDFSKFPNFTEIAQFNERLLTRVREIPGVEAAGIAAAHPLDEGFTNSWRVVGREEEGRDWPEISVRLVSPGYVEAMGLALDRGRVFGAGDNAASPPVALINEATARRFFEGKDPIGQEIRFWGINRRIVGVVGNERIHGLTSEAPPATYAPIAQAPPNTGVLLVRSSRDPAQLGPELRRAIASLDPLLAVHGVEPFVTTLAATLAQRRFAMLVLGAFALVTIVLAVVGVHGVVSYGAAQRTREIGIRQALGATRASVIALVLRGTAVLAALGIAVGLLAAAMASGLLASLLFGVSRFDPVTFLLVPLGIAAVAFASSYLPARRAATTSPVSAVRASG